MIGNVGRIGALPSVAWVFARGLRRLVTGLLFNRRFARSFLLEMLHRPGDFRYVPSWLYSLTQDTLSVELPWMPYPAMAYIAAHLPRNARAFEFGGGGSTLWLSRHVASLTTVEHDAAWYGRLQSRLRQAGLRNCTLLLCPPAPEAALSAGDGLEAATYASDRISGSFEAYVKSIDVLDDASLDLVIVDGRSRSSCLLHAIPKVRPGGVLVLDDSDRPEYWAAMTAVAAWPRVDLRGIRPCTRVSGQTTCWRRPRTDGARRRP